MKQKLLNALIAAKIITGDNSDNETNYFNAVHSEVKKDQMFGYEDHDAFINPEHIEFAYGEFPNAHILDFFADDFKLLMCQVNDNPAWIATQVFLGAWEGCEAIVEKYQMPLLFTYPNQNFGQVHEPHEFQGVTTQLVELKDVHVYRMTD